MAPPRIVVPDDINGAFAAAPQLARLHEIGARSCCSALSFRYFDELKREMKTPPSIMAISAQRGQYLRRVDAEDLTDRRHRATRPRFCTPGYSSRSPENDVKCDLVDPGVLAADCLGGAGAFKRNNRAENSRQAVRRRERKLQRFKSARSAFPQHSRHGPQRVHLPAPPRERANCKDRKNRDRQTEDHQRDRMSRHKPRVKMIARLQAASSASHPILLRLESKAGHGAGKPLAATVAQLTDEWAFLFAQLGIPGGSRAAAP